MSRSLTAFVLTLVGMAAALATISVAQTQPAGSQPATARAAAEKPLPLALLATPAKPLVENTPAGRIDWTSGEVYAVGVARATGRQAHDIAMAKRAARLVAARNAILAISGVRLGPSATFASGQISVDAVLEQYQEVSSEFDPQTLTATSTLRAPLWGAQGLVKMRGLKLNPTRGGRPAAKGPVVVVDARETRCAPCLFPRLQTNEGGTLFDAADLPEPRRTTEPAATYVLTESTAALTFNRSVADFVVVKARQAAQDKCALVLDKEQVDILVKAFPGPLLTVTGKVVIVTDLAVFPPPSSPRTPAPALEQ